MKKFYSLNLEFDEWIVYIKTSWTLLRCKFYDVNRADHLISMNMVNIVNGIGWRELIKSMVNMVNVNLISNFGEHGEHGKRRVVPCF